MASRQEEKEQRRRERMEAEQAEQGAKARAKRLQLALAALLTVAVVVGVVLVVTGGDDGDGMERVGNPSDSTPTAKIPPVRERNLEAAAKAAGCTLASPPIAGQSHVEGKVKYKDNPPTSGDHHPEPALDGIYDPGNSPAPENWVHTLEHGRVAIQYREGTPAAQIEQLATLASEPLNGKNAYKVVLLQNTTDMKPAVSAVAWGQSLSCPEFNEKIFDAIRAFRVKYVDKGPEVGIPPNN